MAYKMNYFSMVEIYVYISNIILFCYPWCLRRMIAFFLSLIRNLMISLIGNLLASNIWIFMFSCFHNLYPLNEIMLIFLSYFYLYHLLICLRMYRTHVRHNPCSHRVYLLKRQDALEKVLFGDEDYLCF